MALEPDQIEENNEGKKRHPPEKTKVSVDSEIHRISQDLGREIDDELEMGKKIFCIMDLDMLDTYEKNNERQDETANIERRKENIRQAWIKLSKQNQFSLYSFIDEPRIQLIMEGLSDPKVCEYFKQNPHLTEIKKSGRKSPWDAFNKSSRDNAIRGKIKNAKGDKKMALMLWANLFIWNPQFLKEIPFEILRKITVIHINKFEEKREKLAEEKIPAVVKKARSLLHDAVDNGMLPITHERIKDVFSNTKISFADPLKMHLENYVGAYTADRETIFLSPELDEENLLKTVVHEYLHALSGKTVVTEDDFSESTNIVRIGTKFKSILQKPSQFQWLNEAITETLTQKIAPSKKGTYQKERELLAILSEDVPLENFIKAHFEDFDPDLVPEERIKAWRELNQKLNTAFGDRFLVGLEKKIKTSGIDEIAYELKEKKEKAKKQAEGIADTQELQNLTKTIRSNLKKDERKSFIHPNLGRIKIRNGDGLIVISTSQYGVIDLFNDGEVSTGLGGKQTAGEKIDLPSTYVKELISLFNLN